MYLERVECYLHISLIPIIFGLLGTYSSSDTLFGTVALAWIIEGVE